jgi:hypothetical protein
MNENKFYIKEKYMYQKISLQFQSYSQAQKLNFVLWEQFVI